MRVNLLLTTKLIRRLKMTLLLACFILVSPSAYASQLQTTRDSVTFSFHFRVGDDLLMRDYKENSRMLDQLKKLIRDVESADIASIHIIGSTSPEGNHETNNALAWKRSKAVKGYIVWQFPQVEQHIIHLSIQSDCSAEWLRAVETDPTVPRREKVLEILHTQASLQTKWANIQLLVGNPADYMKRTIFPRLRNAVSCVVVLKAQTAEEQQQNDPSATTDHAVTANRITEQADTTDLISEPLSELTAEQQMSPVTLLDTKRISKSDPKRAAIAIKTNLLFDLISAINLEVEVPLGRRWSIAAGAVFPQWNFNNRYCLTLTEFSVEPRLWLGDRDRLASGVLRNSLTGHFIGVYGNYIDNYDLQWRHDGVIGSGYGAGITYGYSHRLGRHFNMEYSIGFGALYLKNKSFRVDDGYSYLELKKSSEGWKFLPTRAKISLIWLIGNKDAKNK